MSRSGLWTTWNSHSRRTVCVWLSHWLVLWAYKCNVCITRNLKACSSLTRMSAVERWHLSTNLTGVITTQKKFIPVRRKIKANLKFRKLTSPFSALWQLVKQVSLYRTMCFKKCNPQTLLNIKITVFQCIMPCSLVHGHHTTSHMAIILTLSIVRNSNLAAKHVTSHT